jgi:hypothetical protein
MVSFSPMELAKIQKSDNTVGQAAQKQTTHTAGGL